MLLLVRLKQLLRNPWIFGICSLGILCFMTLVMAFIDCFCDISFMVSFLTAILICVFCIPIIPAVFYAKVYKTELSFWDAMKIPAIGFFIYYIPSILREVEAFRRGELTGELIASVIMCAMVLKVMNKICLWYCNKKEKALMVPPLA